MNYQNSTPFSSIPGAAERHKRLFQIDIDLPDEDLASYELVGLDKAWDHREWCIPAEILNRGRRRLLTEEEEAAVVLPEFESFYVRSVSWGAFMVRQEPEGPVNPPLHVPGKWYWLPYKHRGEYPR
jgi:hypothetical protein